MYRKKIVIYYIWNCIKSGKNPWNFFQLNSNYFNTNKGVYSKLEIDLLVPKKWRLSSILIKNTGSTEEKIKDIESQIKYPFYLKPEWGQNSHGVQYIKNRNILQNHLESITIYDIPYLCQEASGYKYEFEILYCTDKNNKSGINILSIIAVNNANVGLDTINGVLCPLTSYTDISKKITGSNKKNIENYMLEIADFQLARAGIKANSMDDIIKGKFQIFEINLFIPFPLNLLDTSTPEIEKTNFIRYFAKTLSQITQNISYKNRKSIFFTKTFRHYKILLNHNPTYMKLKQLIYKFLEDKFLNGCSDYNGVTVRRSCRSKKQARDIFELNNIPHAKGKIFYNPYTAYKFAKEIGFPVVLKPNVGGFSRGSYFPISNWKDFWKAMFLVKLRWPSSVIEQYLLGKNYRVVVTKGEINVVNERFSAFLIGNGIDTISTLIDKENKIRQEMDLFPIIHKIEKSSIIQRYLHKQNYTFDSILENEKNISLYHRVSLAPGGVLKNIDVSKVTDKNKEIFLKILDLFKSNIFGIDVIMEKGVDVDYDKQKCIFLEVNSRPYLKMHSKPRFGNKPDMTKLYEKLNKIEIETKGIL